MSEKAPIKVFNQLKKSFSKNGSEVKIIEKG